MSVSVRLASVIDHITIRVSDRAASEAFYDLVLGTDLQAAKAFYERAAPFPGFPAAGDWLPTSTPTAPTSRS